MLLGVGEAGGLGGRVGGQAAPTHSGLSSHYGQAWWGSHHSAAARHGSEGAARRSTGPHVGEA